MTHPTPMVFPWSESGIKLLETFNSLIKKYGGSKQLISEIENYDRENSKIWTDGEITFLIRRVNGGEKKPNMPGRSANSVSTKISQLRAEGYITDRTRPVYWTKSEINLLRDFVNAKQKPVIFGRSDRSISHKLRVLGLSRKGLKLRAC